MKVVLTSGASDCGNLQRIMLVEDHGDTRALLARLLRARGYEVHAAAGFAEAMELARTFEADLLIADIHLPDGDGLQLLPSLRQLRHGGPTLRGIIFSAHDPWQAVELARAAGYRTCITKPASFDRLLSAVRHALASPVHSIPDAAESLPELAPAL